jgi:hypothetical protein
MRRREFITLFGGAAAIWLVAPAGRVLAQQAAKVPRVGVLVSASEPHPFADALRRGHPNWYTTAGFRAKNNGMLGRSLGCITVDPAENNKIITRLRGALIYVTVGDAPIEQYL